MNDNSVIPNQADASEVLSTDSGITPGTDVTSGTGGHMRKWVTAINGWTEYMLAAGLSANTIRSRRYQIARLAEAHLRRSPWRVTSGDLIGWMAAHRWSTSTRQGYKAALRSFYGWGKLEGHIRTSPAEDLPKIRKPKHRPRPMPDDVMDRAITEAEDDRQRLVLVLAGRAGLRRAEIATLRWSDIVGEALYIRGKGDVPRVVPLHPALADELRAESVRRKDGQPGSGFVYSAGRSDDGGWVFPGRIDGHMTPEHIGRIGNVGGQWTLHTLRHRFGTRLLESTGNLATVQDLLGHASPETTRNYTDVSSGSYAAAVNSI